MKKTKPQGCKPDVAVKLSYGVTIPEDELMKLIQFDCAKAVKKMGEEFFKEIPAELAVASAVLGIIQDAWSDAVVDFTKKGKKGQKKPAKKPIKTADKPKEALSPADVNTIVKLRKQGKSLKEVGKAIHRSDKTVSAYLKAHPEIVAKI